MPPYPRKITDVVKLRNSKCKRSKNLIKKCMELSTLCGLKVNLVIFDEDKNRIQEFSSQADFRVEQIAAMKVQPSVKRKRKQLKIKYISNDDIPQYFDDEGDAHSMDDHHS